MSSLKSTHVSYHTFEVVHYAGCGTGNSPIWLDGASFVSWNSNNSAVRVMLSNSLNESASGYMRLNLRV